MVITELRSRDHAFQEAENEMEYSNGVTRREVICLGITAAAVVLAKVARGADVESTSEMFLRESLVAAERFVSATERTSAAETSYLNGMEERFRTVTKVSQPEYQSHPWNPALMQYGRLGTRPVRMVFVRMEPGAELPLHDHVGHVGLLRVLNGKMGVEIFADDRGASPKDGGLLLRKVSSSTLTRDHYTRVVQERPYHRIVALGSEAVEFVDVMTIYATGTVKAFSRRIHCNSPGNVCRGSWLD